MNELLQELLLSLIPPPLEGLIKDDDWAIAGDYWEERDNKRARFCRALPIVNGSAAGTLVSRDAPPVIAITSRLHDLVPSRWHDLVPTQDAYRQLRLEVAPNDEVRVVFTAYYVESEQNPNNDEVAETVRRLIEDDDKITITPYEPLFE